MRYPKPSGKTWQPPFGRSSGPLPEEPRLRPSSCFLDQRLPDPVLYSEGFASGRPLPGRPLPGGPCLGGPCLPLSGPGMGGPCLALPGRFCRGPCLGGPCLEASAWEAPAWKPLPGRPLSGRPLNWPFWPEAFKQGIQIPNQDATSPSANAAASPKPKPSGS